MDLSSLIFVALFVAWAAYLVPMALRQHEEDDVSRSVDGFSDRLRVLARRDAVSASAAALVPAGRAQQDGPTEVAADEPADERDEEAATPTPASRTARPTARSTRSAAQRRRRVLGVVLLALVVTAALGAAGVIALAWTALPGALLVAWLVLCRVMVRREHARRVAAARRRRRRRTLADEALEAEDAPAARAGSGDAVVVGLSDDTDEIPAVRAELADAGVDDGWTPVEVPLPTYVDKAPAGRSVRTIDLDSTGVWSSGRNEADSLLAREADAQRAQAEPDVAKRATGS